MDRIGCAPATQHIPEEMRKLRKKHTVCVAAVGGRVHSTQLMPQHTHRGYVVDRGACVPAAHTVLGQYGSSLCGEKLIFITKDTQLMIHTQKPLATQTYLSGNRSGYHKPTGTRDKQTQRRDHRAPGCACALRKVVAMQAPLLLRCSRSCKAGVHSDAHGTAVSAVRTTAWSPHTASQLMDSASSSINRCLKLSMLLIRPDPVNCILSIPDTTLTWPVASAEPSAWGSRCAAVTV